MSRPMLMLVAVAGLALPVLAQSAGSPERDTPPPARERVHPERAQDQAAPPRRVPRDRIDRPREMDDTNTRPDRQGPIGQGPDARGPAIRRAPGQAQGDRPIPEGIERREQRRARLMQRFDANQDGRLDQQEREMVRALIHELQTLLDDRPRGPEAFDGARGDAQPRAPRRDMPDQGGPGGRPVPGDMPPSDAAIDRAGGPASDAQPQRLRRQERRRGDDVPPPPAAPRGGGSAPAA